MQREDISTSKHRESLFEYYQLTLTVGHVYQAVDIIIPCQGVKI